MPGMGTWGLPRWRQDVPTVLRTSVDGPCWVLATRGDEQSVGAAESRTGWYSGPSRNGSWPGPQVRREAGAGRDSKRAGGAPQRSGGECRSSHQKMEGTGGANGVGLQSFPARLRPPAPSAGLQTGFICKPREEKGGETAAVLLGPLIPGERECQPSIASLGTPHT